MNKSTAVQIMEINLNKKSMKLIGNLLCNEGVPCFGPEHATTLIHAYEGVKQVMEKHPEVASELKIYMDALWTVATVMGYQQNAVIETLEKLILQSEEET